MFEFLLFLKSLIYVIIDYIYNNYLIKFKKHYWKLGINLTKNQKKFIIWPISIVFILSYPSIYSIYNSGIDEVINGNGSLQIKDIGFQSQNFDINNLNTLSLKQIWLTPNIKESSSSNILNKSILIDCLNFQNQLLTNINNNDENFAYIHTPLITWNNDLTLLDLEKNPIKSIRQNSQIWDNGLLSGVVKINGLIKSADSLRILIFYKESKNGIDAGSTWDQNLQNLQENSDFKMFKFHNEQSSTMKSFFLKLTKMNSLDHLILNGSYLLIMIYFLISLTNLKYVQSKIGLLFAFIIEISLSILSSATITSFLFQGGVDFKEIHLEFLPFIIIVVGIENTFRLINSISQTPVEQSIQLRVSQGLSDVGLTSTLVSLLDLILLILIYPFVSINTQKFLIFASITLIIDHFLHLTFFAAVLSVDIHRLELDELLNNRDSKKNNIYDSLNSTSENSKLFKIIKFIKNIKLPISTTATGTIVIILFLIITNIRWTDNNIWSNLLPTSHSQNSINNDPLNLIKNDDVLINFIDKKSLSSEIINLSYKNNEKDLSKVLIKIYEPKIISHGPTRVENFDFTLNTTYKFDLYYVLEFLTSLAFILSIILLILKIFQIDNPISENLNDPNSKEISKLKQHSFNSKILTGGHFLDIIKIETSRSPFIVSIGLDHKLLVWSPASQPMPVPSQLPINSSIWPITHVTYNDLDLEIKINELENTKPLEAFFRIKTIPAFLQRKLNLNSKIQNTSAPSSRRNSMRSIASPALIPSGLSFTNTAGAHTDLKELVIILKDGRVARLSCEDGSLTFEKLTNSKLVSSAKLITPRVNDRLVSFTEDGKVLLSTAVNNKWKTRIVHIDEYKFNNPEAFSTPPPQPLPPNDLRNSEIDKEKLTKEFSKSEIAIVPFVGFIVRTHGIFAEIIDVQTGILMKRFKIQNLKKDSLHVFHDQPTHCRFCGSVSITSFTIVYTTEKNSVIMHTFNVDHKAKTSICLRVERDPREIRCVGFDQVTEHKHELKNVEGWSCTDKNQIVGIRRKTEDEVKKSLEKSEKISTLRRRKNLNKNFNQNFDQNAPRLHDLWEGWSMAADGKVDYYEIPDEGSSGGLLVNSIGQINSFGHKSIVVAFGNIMRVLYLGNDNLIYNDEDHNQKNEISGLNFVNKRRKNLRKIDNLTSTNFSEIDTVPGISELAL
ncbi:Sterol regulatory element-binding protein cleavage-activating protein [Wickerhamomyces ciferrii]|uniref:Sterol regulatory element-binding protein cleavage-activating protein n=1 Tax=Wickerhamomyces ciferrii (strain ATCC 14091 / BCRC 22168 / CBS 111 / JCM 3599 / NBRC 0793 / NRRL Y-1031 F-60-10) TaxID=1206466 RepID=K0KKJ8_WICCF|nr:Sterol regulatory element-binding protein cleavage-activating protein [Wickerhamomyces ciferrii]CCH42682.1 Sterol regulatory element-binding protein cleavage-activating protein [Wickerhamomyces ciferrii]